jgi:Zn-dependent protease with chaperone function
VYEVEISVDTKMHNAYVAGFAGTKRIVLWDTIIARFERDELLSVMAHEMGHYVLGHTMKGIGVISALIVMGLVVAHFASGPLIARFQGRFAFRELADVASFPLVIILFQVTSLVLVPAFLAYSRHIEREADRFSLELVRDNHAAARAFVKLSVENLAYPAPGPVYTLFRASHPSIAERVEFCNTYRPWETGEPLRYERYFRSAGGAGSPDLP